MCVCVCGFKVLYLVHLIHSIVTPRTHLGHVFFFFDVDCLVSKLFQLSIYTQGTRPYANNIAQIVDPTKALFANRIVSREQAGEENTRHLKV